MIHEGEYGFRLALRTGYDFTGYDGLTINIRKPDGSRESLTASSDDASGGELYIEPGSSVFADPGTYRIQGVIEFTGKKVMTERVSLRVRSAV